MHNDTQGEKSPDKSQLLQNTSVKYGTLVNNLQQGFCIIEMIFDSHGHAVDYRFLEVNPVFTAQTGLHNVEGKTMKELQPAHEQHWFERYGTVAKTGKAAHFEDEAAHLIEGVWYEVSAFPFDPPGSNLVAVLFNDITARKQQEKIQEYLLQLNDSLRFLINPAEIEKAVTKLAMKYFGADRCFYIEILGDDAAIQRDAFRDGLPSLAGTYSVLKNPLLQKVVHTGHPFVIEDTRTTEQLDAATRQVCLDLEIISGVWIPLLKAGNVVGILCLAQSTPRTWTQPLIQWAIETAERTWAAVERSRAEEELRKSELQLKQLLLLRDEFISVASHELKTPVTSIKVYGELIEKELRRNGDQANAQLTAKLNKQVNRLQSLVMHLLDTSAISEGQLVLSFEDTDINELLKERIGELMLISEHFFEWDLQQLPLIAINKERIGQAITNLVSNAIKYSPAGSTVKVASKVEQNGIRVSITDEGQGIAKKDLPKIFDRFYRGNHHQKHTYLSMGLGLYITHQIILKHGGFLTVTSEEKAGSTFSFFLPLNNAG